MIDIFIGYDEREKIAYSKLCDSIISHSSSPVRITPLHLKNFKSFFTRKAEGSTAFSISRFLVPYLKQYQGWAIYMDCDMLMLDDISNLWALREAEYDVQVCQHDYIPSTQNKFLGNDQKQYDKKNWSSLMLFNCNKCTSLTLNYVYNAQGLDLHQFKWADKVGKIPLEWNWLAGEYEFNSEIKNIHFTLGGPWFQDTTETLYDDYWNKWNL
jgi:lipopolysaccharide biosynthesis glycosyltransferase